LRLISVSKMLLAKRERFIPSPSPQMIQPMSRSVNKKVSHSFDQSTRLARPAEIRDPLVGADE
jgi:hypothetical protein